MRRRMSSSSRIETDSAVSTSRRPGPRSRALSSSEAQTTSALGSSRSSEKAHQRGRQRLADPQPVDEQVERGPDRRPGRCRGRRDRLLEADRAGDGVAQRLGPRCQGLEPGDRALLGRRRAARCGPSTPPRRPSARAATTQPVPSRTTSPTPMPQTMRRVRSSRPPPVLRRPGRRPVARGGRPPPAPAVNSPRPSTAPASRPPAVPPTRSVIPRLRSRPPGDGVGLVAVLDQVVDAGDRRVRHRVAVATQSVNTSLDSTRPSTPVTSRMLSTSAVHAAAGVVVVALAHEDHEVDRARR